MDETFYNDVLTGLKSNPKYLLSKYFYDAAGDVLFQQIMKSPDYYLTRSEMEIFTGQTAALANALTDSLQVFDIVELGAGDASKSIHLLKFLAGEGRDFTYFPVDISENIIELLEEKIPRQISGQKLVGLNGEYFEMIKKSHELSHRPKIVLFLGSSIGNLSREEAERFLKSLHRQLLPGHRVLIGFDLKKDPYRILAAYNDKEGITKAFNLNLLKRMNDELHANFNPDDFYHYPTYDPVTGACRSFLISAKDQQVMLNNAEQISFQKHEPIYMELSQKYSLAEICSLATKTGFATQSHFLDANEWFVDVVWERV